MRGGNLKKNAVPAEVHSHQIQNLLSSSADFDLKIDRFVDHFTKAAVPGL